MVAQMLTWKEVQDNYKDQWVAFTEWEEVEEDCKPLYRKCPWAIFS